MHRKTAWHNLIGQLCVHWLVLCYEQKTVKDVSNFDREFTSEAPKLTPTDKLFIMNLDQTEFAGFSYVNPEFIVTVWAADAIAQHGWRHRRWTPAIVTSFSGWGHCRGTPSRDVIRWVFLCKSRVHRHRMSCRQPTRITPSQRWRQSADEVPVEELQWWRHSGRSPTCTPSLSSPYKLTPVANTDDVIVGGPPQSWRHSVDEATAEEHLVVTSFGGVSYVNPEFIVTCRRPTRKTSSPRRDVIQRMRSLLRNSSYDVI